VSVVDRPNRGRTSSDSSTAIDPVREMDLTSMRSMGRTDLDADGLAMRPSQEGCVSEREQDGGGDLVKKRLMSSCLRRKSELRASNLLRSRRPPALARRPSRHLLPTRPVSLRIS
jgi:hypothetical protein